MNKNKNFKDLSNMCKDILEHGTNSLNEQNLLDVIEAAKCVFDHLYEFIDFNYEDFNDFPIEDAVQKNSDYALDMIINIYDDLSCYLVG